MAGMHQYGARGRRNVDALWSLTTVLLGEEETAPGTPGYNPAWYAQTAVYVDPSNATGLASNANAGTSAITPLLTWSEVVRRYGSNRPQFNYGQSCVFHILSAWPAGQDSIFFEPQLSGGGQAVLDCRAAWVAAGANFAAGALSRYLAPVSQLAVS